MGFGIFECDCKCLRGSIVSDDIDTCGYRDSGVTQAYLPRAELAVGSLVLESKRTQEEPVSQKDLSSLYCSKKDLREA